MSFTLFITIALGFAHLVSSRMYEPTNQFQAGNTLASSAHVPAGVFEGRQECSPGAGADEGPSTPANPANTTASSMIRNAYYPAWTQGFGLDDILWDEFDMICYFVAETSPEGLTVPENQVTIEDFVSAARSHGKMALVSIGGWSGSMYFSSLTSEDQRDSFVDELANFANQYGIDGIDFDWEYPNADGIGCNQRSPDDMANLLATLQLLRQRMGEEFILTADAFVTPYNDASGNPTQDLSGFADVLTYITPMAYSIYGSWSETSGPESPLYNCGPEQSSAESALAAYTAAGFPASKILMGISGLGAAFQTTSNELVTQNYDGVDTLLFQQTTGSAPQGSVVLDPDFSSQAVCGVTAQGYGGFWNYQRMVDEGVLNEDGTQALGNFQRYFDQCTGTPFVFSSSDRVLISYSDAEGQANKIRWMQENGIAGWSLYDLTNFPQNVYDDVRSRLAN